jgi:hypothetical protein
MTQGSCLCGDVAFEIAGPFVEVHHCHCGYCRKAHGTPFGTYGVAAATGMRWLRGQEKIARYESSPGFQRAFCPRCGSILPGSEVQGLIFVPLGNLDGDPGARAEHHIFTSAKASWWEIHDALPQHAHFPPGFDAPVHPAKKAQDPPGRPRGSCLCGRVAYVVDGDPLRAVNCYCGRCRKARAAAHATNLFVEQASLRFTRGEDELAAYKVPDAQFFTQVFCHTCGSTMPRKDPGRGIAVIPMGGLDDDPHLGPQRHIFVADRAPWVEIHDDLPRHEAYPPPEPPPQRPPG